MKLHLKNKSNAVIIFMLILLSFSLNFYAINKYGYGNKYYAATILSMRQSFKNFFFLSFDPLGLIAVDKPPIGLWIQTLSTFIFGYKGWAMLLPQALASTGSCILIYIMTNKYLNRKSAVLSAVIFATTPIVVAVSRNNTMDMQLIFVLLLSTYFLFKAFEKEKTIYFVICCLLIGIGFNVKMLQAYMIVPAVFLVYFLFFKANISKKIITMIASGILIVLVSLSWATVVEFYPKSERPYVDSTANNSMYELIIEHNGLRRVLGNDYNSSLSTNNINKNNGSIPVANTKTQENHDDIGSKSIIRLWNSYLFGQISWFLLFAIAAILTCNHKIKLKTAKLEDIYFIFWEINFICIFIFFSFAGFYHRYYLSMLAPPIAVLSGIAIPKMFHEFNEKTSWRKYIFPITMFLTIGLTINHVSMFYDSIPMFLYVVLACSVICIISLLLSYFKGKNYLHDSLVPIILLTLFIAPFYWSLTPVIYVPNITRPSAGPDLNKYQSNDINASIKGSTDLMSDTFALEDYLVKHYKKDSFLVVSCRCEDVNQFIVNTGLPCYAYGGFLGYDNTLSIDDLKDYIAQGKITYFLISPTDEKFDTPILDYVRTKGKLIDPSEYEPNMTLKAQKKLSYKLYSFVN